ncbi:hypothetical protein V1520DRAFT_48219 [Lipomyces starkeyi]|uniref:BAH domain-containing protein n=1 Tax=Lipomyces starkeyi NRRL Y-11557 TaxID=675824 RepID=A0A1E3QE73_LIPST|nr:hypothetical protein LIPSTDRAFT_216314 [Lipomyces starkeyi NRRL Y-11557]
MAAGSPSPGAGLNGTGKLLSPPTTENTVDTPATLSKKKVIRSPNKKEIDNTKTATKSSPNSPRAKGTGGSASYNDDAKSNEDSKYGGNSDQGEEEEVENGAHGNDQASEQSLPNTDVPFTVVRKAGTKSNTKKAKKRKHGEEDGDDTTSSPTYADPEDSPDYVVQPKADWEQLSKYRNFVVGDERFTVGDYVFVNHASNMNDIGLSDPSQFWIGRVLEIRASDPSHVYVRLFWMYWPNELPGGRRYYHGNKELVASNHMDVIDAMTVAAKATVSHWLELDDEDKLADLFWRQRYDSYNNELMPIRKHCKCKRYYNPDTTMIWCSSCNSWLHEACVIDDIKKRYKNDIQILADDKKKKATSSSRKAKSLKAEAFDKAPDDSVQIEVDEQALSAKAVYTSTSGEKKEVSITCLVCGSDIS